MHHGISHFCAKTALDVGTDSPQQPTNVDQDGRCGAEMADAVMHQEVPDLVWIDLWQAHVGASPLP